MEVNSFYVKVERDILLTANSESHLRPKDSPVSHVSSSGLATGSVLTKTYDAFGDRTAAWNELFVKFSTEMANDSELDLEVLSLKEEEIEFSSTVSESEAEEVSEEEIVHENRMPMRKTPAWIRRWIETGLAPYLDTPEDEPITEVLLSEDGISKCPTLIIGGNAPVDASPSMCSSVDTAVYILSNTNITKKSEAMAIVEGSREPASDEFPIFGVRNRGNSSGPAEVLKNNGSTDSRNDVNTEGPIASTSTAPTNFMSTPTKEKVNLSQANGEKPEETPVPTLKPMKITDALLTLEHIADINQATSANDAFSAIFSLSPRSAPKTTVRKKLYTGRDSPIDLIFPTEMNKSSISNNSERHPALMTTPRSQLSKRRVGRSIKRRVSRIVKADVKEKSADKSSESPDTFFTSLGLTPSDKDSSSRQQESSSVSPSKDEENTVESTMKLSSLEKLCAAKQPVIILERVSTHLPVNGDATSENNQSGADVEKNNVTTMTITSNSSQNNLRLKEVHNVDLDSLKSDQSTILIYKCAREAGHTRSKGSKVKKLKTVSQASASNTSPVKKSSEVQEKRNKNLGPASKQKRQPMSLFNASSGSEDDLPSKIESTRLNATQKQTSSIEIPACPDKSLQKNLTTMQDSTESQEKSLNSLDRDESRLSGTIITTAVSHSTLEIVSSEDEAWIDIKKVKNRRKTVAKTKPVVNRRVTEQITRVESQNTLETVTSDNEAWLEAKLDKKRRMTMAKDKSASSLEHNQSRVTEEISPVESQSAVAIVASKNASLIDVNGDKNRWKAVVKRRNSAKPSKEVGKPQEKSANSLNHDQRRITEDISSAESQDTLEIVSSEKEAWIHVKNDKNRRKTVAKEQNQAQSLKEVEKPQEKPANSLNHDQSRITRGIIPAESQSTLEIVASDNEGWIDVKNDRTRRKRNRRNQAQPSKEVENPIESTRNLRKRKLPEDSSPEGREKSRKSAVKRLKYSSDSDASSTELLPSKKKLKASVSPPSLPSTVKDDGKRYLKNSVDKNRSISVLNSHAELQKEEKNKIGIKVHRKQSPVKKVKTPEADENRRITRSGKKSSEMKESDIVNGFETSTVRLNTKNRKKNELRENNLNNSTLNDSNLNNSNVELKNLSVSLSRIQSPVLDELVKKTRSKSFPLEKKILPRINKKKMTSYVRKTRSSERLREMMDNKKMSSPLSRLRSNKNFKSDFQIKNVII